MRISTVTIIAFLVTLVCASSAYANIRRHCDVYYMIHFQTAFFGDNDVAEHIVEMDLDPIFNARGICGDLVPNRCRRRARNIAHECMQNHWNASQNDYPTAPFECRENGGDRDVIDYPYYINLLDEIEDQICYEFSFLDWGIVEVEGITSGNTGCGKVTFLGTHAFFCM